MKKLLRHAMATTLPVVAAKATKEGQRAWRIFKRRLAEVHEEKRGAEK